jgi:hypothetical protein
MAQLRNLRKRQAQAGKMRRSSLGTLEFKEGKQEPNIDFNPYKHFYKPYIGHNSNSKTKSKSIITAPKQAKSSKKDFSKQFKAKYGSPIRESPMLELRKKVNQIEPNNIGQKAQKNLLRFIDY